MIREGAQFTPNDLSSMKNFLSAIEKFDHIQQGNSLTGDAYVGDKPYTCTSCSKNQNEKVIW